MTFKLSSNAAVRAQINSLELVLVEALRTWRKKHKQEDTNTLGVVGTGLVYFFAQAAMDMVGTYRAAGIEPNTQALHQWLRDGVQIIFNEKYMAQGEGDDGTTRTTQA